MGRENLLIQRAWSTLWREGIQVFAMKTLTTFCRRVVVLARWLDDPIPHRPARLPVVIAMLTEKDLAAYSSFRPDQGEKEIQARLARGDQCFAASYEGRIVHAAWVATGRVYVPYLRRDLILQSGDIYLHDFDTLPGYRGHGLAQAGGVHVLQHYRQQGYRRDVAVVAVDNKIGLRLGRAAGYHTIGLYGCVRFGPWQRDWQQPWGEESLPILVGRK